MKTLEKSHSRRHCVGASENHITTAVVRAVMFATTFEQLPPQFSTPPTERGGKRFSTNYYLPVVLQSFCQVRVFIVLLVGSARRHTLRMSPSPNFRYLLVLLYHILWQWFFSPYLLLSPF
ncbi:hypothetical protein CEXT_618431 [Caerostris extrusa]|uniref:Transmembrane protein n=1 Tax=Caerostris extrusa TaxID=172846 RepID=A0AAV4WB98_CAEEX|nr:hypothetical protein CEXT_618431 [Caerostris extrusa]